MADQFNPGASVLEGEQQADMIVPPPPGSLTEAQANLVRQQATGAQIANTRAAAVLRIMQGQPSIANGPGAWTDPNTPPPSSDDADGNPHALDRSQLYGWAQTHYQVRNEYTPQELAQLQIGAQLAAYGDDGLLKATQAIHTARIQQLSTQRQTAALAHYNNAYVVSNAPDGQALAYVRNVGRADPAVAAAASRWEEGVKNGTVTEAEADAAIRDQMGAIGGALFPFTGREYEVGKDGIARDKTDNRPVLGGTPAGLSASEKATIAGDADKVVEVPNTDGTSSKMPAWKYAVEQGTAADRADYIRRQIATAQRQSVADSHGVDIGPAAPSMMPPQPGAFLDQLPPPATPPAAPRASATAAPADNGLLPGVNPAQLPRPAIAPVRPGTSQSPADKITSEALATERAAQLKETAQEAAASQKERALLVRAQAEAGSINPRMVGPGSEFAQGWQKFRTAVTGAAPDDLVDLGALDKVLLNLGVQNVRNALQGQKITQTEMLKMLGEGNPNTEQPLATIQKLLGFLRAQNDYDRRFQKTKTAGLLSGADPYQIDEAIGDRADRSDYIERRTGIAPSARGNTSSQGAAPALPDAGANKGRSITMSGGQRLISDGSQWHPIAGAAR